MEMSPVEVSIFKVINAHAGYQVFRIWSVLDIIVVEFYSKKVEFPDLPNLQSDADYSHYDAHKQPEEEFVTFYVIDQVVVLEARVEYVIEAGVVFQNIIKVFQLLVVVLFIPCQNSLLTDLNQFELCPDEHHFESVPQGLAEKQENEHQQYKNDLGQVLYHFERVSFIVDDRDELESVVVLIIWGLVLALLKVDLGLV